MTVGERNDAILVRFITFENDKEKFITCYHTTAINETIKMFITAKEYDLPLTFNEFSDEVAEEYQKDTFYVKDLYIGLGSKSDLPAIEVII